MCYYILFVLGSYGLPKPWYFPVTKSYWLGHPKTELDSCSWRSCCQKSTGMSVMEEDQAGAMATGGGKNLKIIFTD